MIAYDNIKLENTLLIEQAENLFSKQFIEKEQLAQVQSHLPHLKTSSFFIRIGFFLLGSFLVSSIMGFFSLITLEAFQNYSIQLYLGILLSIVGSEFLSKKEFYRHGLNDAFVLSIILFATSAVGVSTESFALAFFVMTLSGLCCAVRYVHTVSAILSCLGFVCFFGDLVIQEKIISTVYLPFLGLTLGLLFYFTSSFLHHKEDNYFYKNSFFAIKIFSLLLIYFSMNYLVVRELSIMLMNIVVENGNDIPFAIVFYGLTFAIPIFYIVFGLKNKDRVFLMIGLFTFGFSIFTIRYYYAILPLETALVIGGILLFLISIFSIKFLKNKASGLTFQADRGNDKSEILNAQAFLINSQINTVAPAKNQSKMTFGGGGFSGGGSGESF